MWRAPFLGLLFLGSCAIFGAVEAVPEAESFLVEQVCRIWKPISYDSVLDTPETVAEVRANNARRSAFCNGETRWDDSRMP